VSSSFVLIYHVDTIVRYVFFWFYPEITHVVVVCLFTLVGVFVRLPFQKSMGLALQPLVVQQLSEPHFG
jgi:hypothetical protein